MSKTTVTFKGIDLEVTYDYTPEEKGVWRDNDGGVILTHQHRLKLYPSCLRGRTSQMRWSVPLEKSKN
jgi:hypothetical protein